MPFLITADVCRTGRFEMVSARGRATAIRPVDRITRHSTVIMQFAWSVVPRNPTFAAAHVRVGRVSRRRRRLSGGTYTQKGHPMAIDEIERTEMVRSSSTRSARNRLPRS